jgi:hypothetical protein
MQYFYTTLVSGVGTVGKRTAKEAIFEINSTINEIQDTKFPSRFANYESECVMSSLSPHYTTPSGLLQALKDSKVRKLIPVKFTSSGFVTSCSLDVHVQNGSEIKVINGMAFFEFPGCYDFPEIEKLGNKCTTNGSLPICRLRIFWEAE